MQTVTITFHEGEFFSTEAFTYDWQGKLQEQLYAVQFVFEIKHEQFSWRATLKVTNAYTDYHKFKSSIFECLRKEANVIFKNGNKLNLFGGNEYKFSEKDIAETEAPQSIEPIIVSIEISEEVFVLLAKQAEKRERLFSYFNNFKDYLFDLTPYGASNDNLVRPYLRFIHECLSNSSDQYHRLSDLSFVEAQYLKGKAKSTDIELAKRKLYTIRAPQAYDKEPYISEDVEKAASITNNY